MKNFTITISSNEGQVISFKKIKAKDIQSANYQAEHLKTSWIPLNNAQKEMSKNGIIVTIK